ncbi:MAG: hypothetical protein GY757_42875 [bacterium]|nr:hypothetical protein [bacterium]
MILDNMESIIGTEHALKRLLPSTAPTRGAPGESVTRCVPLAPEPFGQ